MPVNAVTESPRNCTRPQARDLEVVDVPPDQKRDQQVEHAQARDGPRQPSPSRAEIGHHEPRGRDEHSQQRDMCPPHCREQFFGRADSHLPQFTKREGGCGGCGHGKEQIGPCGAVAPPHKKVDHRQREARRRDHGPDDGDPTHELSFPDSILGRSVGRRGPLASSDGNQNGCETCGRDQGSSTRKRFA